MTIIAHFRRDKDGKVVVQALRNHLVNVAEKMEVAATPWGLGALAKLTGLLHDFSKSRSQWIEGQKPFQVYIRDIIADAETAVRDRGKIDHSTGGAKFLWKRYGSLNEEMKRKTINLIDLSVMSHHGGLANFLSERGESDYVRRLQKKALQRKRKRITFLNRSCHRRSWMISSIKPLPKSKNSRTALINAVRLKIVKTAKNIGFIGAWSKGCFLAG